MILLTSQDCHGLWHCTDGNQENSPCAPHGQGESPHAAVADFLSQLSNDQLDALWWDALGGLNAAWMPSIKTESDARQEWGDRQW